MSILFLSIFLAGALLGLRLRVFVLAPGIGITIPAVLAVGLARGETLFTIMVAALIALICLQVGYVAGILTRYAMTLARAGSHRKDRFQPKSAGY